MKKILTNLLIIAVLSISSTYAQSNSATTKVTVIENYSFGVRGNCGMCKKTIEKAAMSVEGVSKANWDKEKKVIHVTFNKAKTSEMAIQKAVAASGYDTEKVPGNLEAYKKLPGCCKYDHNMKMNLK